MCTTFDFQSGSVNICAVTEEVKQALKEFRFRKAQDTSALVCKLTYKLLKRISWFI